MNKKLYKYAELLINKCIPTKSKSLVISFPIEAFDFVTIVSLVAYKKGFTDIYYDFNSSVINSQELTYLKNNDIKNSKRFNKSIYDEYAKKNAAFLFLTTTNIDAYKDIDKEKLALSNKVTIESYPLYKKRQMTYDVAWCIAGVATLSWAKKVFPKSSDPVKDLWNEIFKLCLVNESDPIKSWTNKMKNNAQLVKKLNDMKITKLTYKNKLGTDFSIEFNDNVWCGGNALGKDNQELIVNMPTEEVFTTPNKYTANGIVYASKPLFYNGILIKDFYIKFDKGKVVEYNASNGLDALKSIIDIKNGNYLGEVALVDVTSPISKSNILFYNTLFDENASCHLALGSGFTECIKTKKDLKEIGFNESVTHVDFMVGTPDLEIVAETKDGNVTIMKNGKFCI